MELLCARVRGHDRDMAWIGAGSPYGTLPNGPTPWHAVCLVGVAGRSFWILDPWSRATDQPLTLTFEEFATAWTGEVVLVGPRH
jgi:hypothetical protein